MDKRNVSGILERISNEASSLFGEEHSNFRFIFGGYLADSEKTLVVGESLNIVSARGLKKVATVNLSYSEMSSVPNEVHFYSNKYSIRLRHVFKVVLKQEGVLYREVCENV